ncbi:MAG: hypothetical protein AABO41_25145 [Acidobacteriota bacterium]
MRRLVMVVSILLGVQVAALGQTASEPRGWGYGFGGVGGTSGGSIVGTLHVGGGGEWLVHKGFGLGAEIGYLSPLGDLGEGIGILSTNVGYHFVKPNHKLVPFVTGGFSLGFKQGPAAEGTSAVVFSTG